MVVVDQGQRSRRLLRELMVERRDRIARDLLHVRIVVAVVVVLEAQVAHELVGPIEIIRHRAGPPQHRCEYDGDGRLHGRSTQRRETRDRTFG